MKTSKDFFLWEEDGEKKTPNPPSTTKILSSPETWGGTFLISGSIEKDPKKTVKWETV